MQVPASRLGLLFFLPEMLKVLFLLLFLEKHLEDSIIFTTFVLSNS